MGKGLQIILLAVVFAVCGVGGFFLGEVLLSDTQEEVVVEAAPVVEEPVVDEPAPAVPAVPEIKEVSVPAYGADRKYSFSVKAEVHTGDALEYVLYGDDACQKEIVRTLDGVFSGIASSHAGTYYLCVVNSVTGETSAVTPVKGFVFKYDKITKEELERICNSGDYGTAPAKFNHRIVAKLAIVANGIKSDERGVASVADICQKVMMGTWNSISVDEITYDSQNRMKKLTISVNY